MKIHRNRLEHEGDSANCQYLLKNVFLHVKKKKKSPALVEQEDEEKILDGDGN